MVSTTSQYITDAPATSSAEGKNPLALLAKTCETIGLPDTNSNSAEKRRTPEKKDSVSGNTEIKKSPSDSAEKKRISPRATPTTSKSEPITSTTTFPGLPKHAGFPMAFPGMMPFYPAAAGMMPFTMPSFFPMAPFPMGRVPCPAAMMRQPCVTPGCTSCSPDMSAFAANPLFSAYAAMMPTSSAASAMPSYQQLLAAAAAQSAASKQTCTWMESTGQCGKQFSTLDELNSHMKSSHAPSPPSSATTPETKTPSRPSHAARFHPYATKTPMPPMPMTAFSPLAMQQAMFAQRMMGMPHP